METLRHTSPASKWKYITGRKQLLFYMLCFMIGYGAFFQIIPDPATSSLQRGPKNELLTQEAEKVELRASTKQTQGTTEKYSSPSDSTARGRNLDIITKDCHVRPRAEDLVMHGPDFQVLSLPNNSFYYLYSAYYDNRTDWNGSPRVHILGHLRNDFNVVDLSCHLWFDEEPNPVTLPLASLSSRQLQNATLQLLSTTCIMLKANSTKVPSDISVSLKNCTGHTNMIPVHYGRPKKSKDIITCSKGLLHREDTSVMVAEWIEIHKALSMPAITMYIYYVHANTEKILRYYEERGDIELIFLTIPEYVNATPSELYELYIARTPNIELLSFMDCYMRNMHRSKYIAVHDIDEIIVPNRTDLVNLFTAKNHSDYDSFTLFELYHWSNITDEIENVPELSYFLRRNTRAHQPFIGDLKTNSHYKSVHDTSRVVTLGTHYAKGCVRRSCEHMFINSEHALLRHYRNDCRQLYNCQRDYMAGSFVENVFGDYVSDVVRGVSKALKESQFSKDRLLEMSPN